MKYLSLAAAAVMACASATQAATIHNEAIDGDLANFIAPVGDPFNLSFTLMPGATSAIVGALDGDLTPGAPSTRLDQFDVFQFVATEAFTVDLTETGKDIIGALYAQDPMNPNSFGFPTFGGFNGQTTNIFGLVNPGTYAFALTPSGNSGQGSYTLSINVRSAPPAVVPLPASLPLLAVGLLAVGAVSRRRSRA